LFACARGCQGGPVFPNAVAPVESVHGVDPEPIQDKIDVPKGGSVITWSQVKTPIAAMVGERAALGAIASLVYMGCRAFSLTELLVVMVMIALMAALMLPAVSKAKQQPLPPPA